MGKQRVRVGRSWRNLRRRERRRREGGREGAKKGHYTATIHPTQLREGDSIQHETDVVAHTAAAATTGHGGSERHSAQTGTVHTPQGRVRQTMKSVFLSSALFPPLALSLSLSPFWYLPTRPSPPPTLPPSDGASVCPFVNRGSDHVMGIRLKMKRERERERAD